MDYWRNEFFLKLQSSHNAGSSRALAISPRSGADVPPALTATELSRALATLVRSGVPADFPPALTATEPPALRLSRRRRLLELQRAKHYCSKLGIN